MINAVRNDVINLTHTTSRMSQVCARIVAIVNNRDESVLTDLLYIYCGFVIWGCEDSQTLH